MFVGAAAVAAVAAVWAAARRRTQVSSRRMFRRWAGRTIAVARGLPGRDIQPAGAVGRVQRPADIRREAVARRYVVP